jgi:hypothetical protein
LFCISADFVPVDEALQVPSPPATPSLPCKRFTAQQVEVLKSAFAVDEFPDRQRQQALALWLAVAPKRVEVKQTQLLHDFNRMNFNSAINS